MPIERLVTGTSKGRVTDFYTSEVIAKDRLQSSSQWEGLQVNIGQEVWIVIQRTFTADLPYESSSVNDLG